VPAPERCRKRSWKQFVKSHWQTLYACDFFAVETLGVFGTVRITVFFVIELKSRAVLIAGIRIDPDGAWMTQIALNLRDPAVGFLRNATHLIHDRYPLYTKTWTAPLEWSGVKSVPIPAKSPNCTPHADRFVKTVRTECLDNFVVFGERHLRHLVNEFVANHDTERYHQGIGSQLIRPRPSPSHDTTQLATIRCRSRLGGHLNFSIARRRAAPGWLSGQYGIGGQLIRPNAWTSNDNATPGPIACRSRLGGLLNFYHREGA
jgi:hypothetical protein